MDGARAVSDSRMPIYGADLPEAVERALNHLASRVLPPTTLMATHGMPLVVQQALSDRQLRPVDRLAMFFLAALLDFNDYREVKVMSLASTMGVEEQTAGRAIRTLVARGYLDQHAKRKPRAFRMPWSRLATEKRAA